MSVWLQITDVESLTYEVSGDRVEFSIGDRFGLLVDVHVLSGCLDVFDRALRDARALAAG